MDPVVTAVYNMYTLITFKIIKKRRRRKVIIILF